MSPTGLAGKLELLLKWATSGFFESNKQRYITGVTVSCFYNFQKGFKKLDWPMACTINILWLSYFCELTLSEEQCLYKCVYSMIPIIKNNIKQGPVKTEWGVSRRKGDREREKQNKWVWDEA